MQIKDPHVKPDILKLIEEKVRRNFKHIGREQYFLNRTPMAYALKQEIDKQDLIKLKSFCKAKDTGNQTKQQPRDQEKIFINPTSDRGLISKICKELKKFYSKKTNKQTNNPIKNRVQN